jgi:glycosyltransferase involved in cell wall biosynthesis
MCSSRQRIAEQAEEQPIFPSKLGIIQRVLPTYRIPFFEKLAARCHSGLEVFAGEPQASEGIRVQGSPAPIWRVRAQNRNLGDVESNVWYMCWQAGTTKWLQKWDPAALVINVNPRLISNWKAIRYMRQRGRPVIGWGLGELPRSGLSAAQSVRRQLAVKQVQACDAIIAYSSKAAGDYREMGVSPERVFAAYNAVDTTIAAALRQQFLLDPTPVLALKAEFSPQHHPIVLTVGRILPQKRIDVLIRACATLDHPCQLVIVGDGPERLALEALATEILPSTRFLGFQSGAELGRTFLATDLFVLPGTGGLAIQEAMGYGKPVLVADADGTEQDLVENGRNGYLLEPGNVRQLRELMDLLLAEPRRLEQMGNASLAIVEHKVNLERMVNVFVTAVNTAANSVSSAFKKSVP